MSTSAASANDWTCRNNSCYYRIGFALRIAAPAFKAIGIAIGYIVEKAGPIFIAIAKTIGKVIIKIAEIIGVKKATKLLSLEIEYKRELLRKLKGDQPQEQGSSPGNHGPRPM